MKRIFFSSLTLCFCLGIAPHAPAQALTSGTTLNGIAAVVGTEIVLRSDVNYQVELGKQNFPNLPDSIIRAQTLQSLIDDKLLYMKAVEDSTQVSDDEVNQELDFKLQQITQMMGSQKRVEEQYGKSIAQIKRDYREDVRKVILGHAWLRAKMADLPRTTRPDVEKFFALYKDSLASQKLPVQYDCSVIAVTVKPSPSARDSARRIGQMLLDSLRNGASFDTLAKYYSEDPSSAVVGGDLGFQKRGIFVKEFDQAAFGLKEGETSGLVETMFGFHIIRLIERRGEEVRVKHILVKVPKTQTDEKAAIDSLLRIRARISAGAAFDAIAAECSEDPDTKPFGGELGPLPSASFPSAIAGAVIVMKPGDMTLPLKSPLTAGDAAYKIFLLNKIIPEHTPTLETDYKQIERIATQYIQQQMYETILQEVRKQVYWAVQQ